MPTLESWNQHLTVYTYVYIKKQQHSANSFFQSCVFLHFQQSSLCCLSIFSTIFLMYFVLKY